MRAPVRARNIPLDTRLQLERERMTNNQPGPQSPQDFRMLGLCQHPIGSRRATARQIIRQSYCAVPDVNLE